MSFAFDIYYHAPEDVLREKKLAEQAAAFGGKLDFRELTGPTNEAVCLTFDFENRDAANRAAEALRLQNENVEGPYDY